MVETRIFGELFDYMMFLKSTYNLTQIFGLLTRYSDWFVCSLEPESASSLKSSLCSRNMEPFELFSPEEEPELDPSTIGAFSSSSFSFTFTKPKKPKKEGQKQSTPSQSLGQDVFNPSKPLTLFKETKVQRKLYVSKICDQKDPNLWQMLVTLLTRMHETTTTSENSSTPIYRYVAEVGPGIKGFQWHSLSPGVSLLEMNFRSFPNRNMKNFYVWENLGHGVSGRAFLVSSKSTASPVVGVMKCFFLQTNEDKETKQKARVQAWDGEAEVWKRVYPNYQCHEVKVFEDRPALLMQYFASIDHTKRKEMVPMVRETLEQNYNKNGLVHGDVQWRNIGQDRAGKVVVYDMGWVKEKKKGEDEGWVDEAIKKLDCDEEESDLEE